MEQVKTGIIGCGMAWERLHYPAFQELQDKYKVVACCDVDFDKARKATEMVGIGQEKAYQDYNEMINQEELDAVDIIVPIPENFPISEDVAERGINIICEKPLATSLEEAEEYSHLADKYGIQIMIAENYRYNEENNIIRDLIREQKIGDVVYFISNKITDFPGDMLGNKFAAKEWRQHPDYPGGRILDSAIHNLAGIRHIFGPIESLHAVGKPQDDDFNPYLSANINLKFKNGIVGQFSYFPSGKEMQRPLVGTRIFGTEGMIYLEESKAGVINVAYNDGTREEISYQPERGFYNELLNFYNSLTGQEAISVPPQMEYGDLKTVMAVLESIEENKVVEVDKYGQYQSEESVPVFG